MASPVTMDFSEAKTLIAFGERAAKHGLAPQDLQKLIDEPERMARLVDYAKAGAPAWQVVALPVIDLRQVYGALGMEVEYNEAIKKWSLVENNGLWTLLVVKGVTCNKVVAGLRKLGVKFYLYADDLDKAVPTNDRDPSNGSYVVSFARTVEADEANKNLSANALKDRGHKGATLLERLLLELGYFLATGKHLDEKNVTLCTGSCNSGGYVPRVYWRSDNCKVYVDWDYPDYSSDSLRSRSAVS